MGHTLDAELKMKRPQGWDAGRTDGPNKNRKRNEGGEGRRGGFRDFKDLGRSKDFQKDGEKESGGEHLGVRVGGASFMDFTGPKAYSTVKANDFKDSGV